jgi:hypothetical protein
MNKFLRFLILISLLTSVPGLAFAATVISQWQYKTDGVFTSYSYTTGAVGNFPYVNGDFAASDFADISWFYSGGVEDPGSVNGPRVLSWGDPDYSQPDAGKSSLSLVPVTGLINTGSTANAIKIVHDNNVIWSPYSDVLSSGIVRATLELTPWVYNPSDPVLSSLKVFSTAIDFAFFETVNDASTPMDMFVILNPGVTTEVISDYLGYDYTFTFGGFTQITESAYIQYFKARFPDYAGPKDDQGNPVIFGWLTPENTAYQLPTTLTITGNPVVPEPSTALLLGFGVLGLGAVARRRSHK